MDDDAVNNVLSLLLQQAPLYLMLFAGLVASLARWSIHPRPAARAALGFAWLILFGLLSDIWRGASLYEWIIPDDAAVFPADELTCACFTALQAVGFLWLLLAIFADRSWKRHPYSSHLDENDEVG